VRVVFPASGCEMIAKVRRRAIALASASVVSSVIGGKGTPAPGSLPAASLIDSLG